MLVYRKGNLLEASEDIICHQCNTLGKFGGGLAAQIKKVYPECEGLVEAFVDYCRKTNESVIGQYYAYHTDSFYTIANCFSQNEDYTTNLRAITEIFSTILERCYRYGLSIAIPYKYGCGIAKGSWNEVRDLFASLSEEFGVDIVVYHLEDIDE